MLRRLLRKLLALTGPWVAPDPAEVRYEIAAPPAPAATMLEVWRVRRSAPGVNDVAFLGWVNSAEEGHALARDRGPGVYRVTTREGAELACWAQRLPRPAVA